MTSFIAAGGSGRSTSVIPAVPAAWSVTTIAFIWDTSLYQPWPARLVYLLTRAHNDVGTYSADEAADHSNSDTATDRIAAHRCTACFHFAHWMRQLDRVRNDRGRALLMR